MRKCKSPARHKASPRSYHRRVPSRRPFSPIGSVNEGARYHILYEEPEANPRRERETFTDEELASCMNNAKPGSPDLRSALLDTQSPSALTSAQCHLFPRRVPRSPLRHAQLDPQQGDPQGALTVSPKADERYDRSHRSTSPPLIGRLATGRRSSTRSRRTRRRTSRPRTAPSPRSTRPSASGRPRSPSPRSSSSPCSPVRCHCDRCDYDIDVSRRGRRPSRLPELLPQAEEADPRSRRCVH